MKTNKDLIDRQQAIDALAKFVPYAICDASTESYTNGLTDAYNLICQLPSAQPTEASCWGCNCPKMERAKEQKTFSEMVHLHDDETNDKRTETHACDSVERQAAIDVCNYAIDLWHGQLGEGIVIAVRKRIEQLPAVQPQRKTDEWCTDCREYDSEKHCCPRWNRVIRQTLSEQRKTGKWILWNYPGEECARCSVCGEEYDQIDLYIGGNDYPKFCPNCGADMRIRGEENGRT